MKNTQEIIFTHLFVSDFVSEEGSGEQISLCKNEIGVKHITKVEANDR